MERIKIEKMIGQLERLEKADAKKKLSLQDDHNLIAAILKAAQAKELLKEVAYLLQEYENRIDIDKIKADLERLLG